MLLRLFLMLCTLLCGYCIANELFDHPAIAVSVYGSSQRVEDSIHSLLGFPDLKAAFPDSRIHVYDGFNASANIAFHAVADSVVAPVSDCAMVIVDLPLLLNEEAVLFRLLTAIRTLRQQRIIPGMKRSLFVVLLDRAAGHVKALSRLADEAWKKACLLDQSNVTLDSITFRSILINSDSPVVPRNVMASTQQFLQEALPSARPLRELLNSTLTKPSPRKSLLELKDIEPELDVGLAEKCAESVKAGLIATQAVLQPALAQLAENVESPKLFRYLIGQFMAVGVSRQLEVLGAYANKQMAQLARQDLLHVLCEQMNPMFHQQIYFQRTLAAQYFNNLINDELVLSPEVMLDLQDMGKQAVSYFQSAIEEMIPKEAQGIWHWEDDVMEFDQTITDFIASKEAVYKLQGILPKTDRIPIELSCHICLMHPLIRDYRQDPLLCNQGDTLVYVPSRALPDIPAAMEARAWLKHKEQSMDKSWRNWFSLRKIKAKSEFAREMMMLPLSLQGTQLRYITPLDEEAAQASIIPTGPITFMRVESPEVRRKIGPERFIRWDISPMDEVNANLNTVMKEDSRQQASKTLGYAFPRSFEQLREQGIKFLSDLVDLRSGGEPTYRHPPVNYGKTHRASKGPKFDKGQ